MPIEIEHKFLLNKEQWKKIIPEKSTQIRQAYLLTDPSKTIRVRTIDNQAYLTIKGKTKGSSRLEFEYEIPIEEANQLINSFCTQLIEKTRHYVSCKKHMWEVDEFHGLNEGLFVAEIELSSEQEEYALPEWIDKNVTHDSRYANSNLTLHPFSTW
jgi:adenylate cyclase